MCVRMSEWTPVTNDGAVCDRALAPTHGMFLNVEIRLTMQSHTHTQAHTHTHTHTQRHSVFTLLEPHQGARTKVSRTIGARATRTLFNTRLYTLRGTGSALRLCVHSAPNQR